MFYISWCIASAVLIFIVTYKKDKDKLIEFILVVVIIAFNISISWFYPLIYFIKNFKWFK